MCCINRRIEPDDLVARKRISSLVKVFLCHDSSAGKEGASQPSTAINAAAVNKC